MKWWISLMAAAGLATVAGCSRPGPQDGMDLQKELERLYTLTAAKDPVPTVSGMVSSFDRTGGNMDWADLKACWVGDDRYMLADLKGPGCLRRIWMTNISAEEWLFYVDEEKSPRIRISEKALFSIQQDGRMPFLPPLADCLSGAGFSYIPIPYARSLRVVIRLPKLRPDARPYFHFNYDTYPAGTPVRSFPTQLSDSDRQAVETAREAWNGMEKAQAAIAAGTPLQEVRIAPGQSASLAPAVPAGTVQALVIRLEEGAFTNAVDRARLLRQLVLRAFWDGTAEPSVDVPLGDFFANGLHQRRYASLPLANSEGTFVCRFPMPFRRGARIDIRNDGPSPVSLRWGIRCQEGDPGAGRYFHASWRQTMSAGTPFRIMRTSGRGAYLGCYLIALGMDGSWNILEGDERFFRDGSTTPVHSGTGLEDYFNGGWYYYGLFERPLHGLLEKAAMRTAQYRFQIPDPVTFEKELTMQMEFGDANRAKGYMSAAAYWYQEAPGPAGSDIPPVSARFPPLERIGAASSMCGLFELERAGLAREAEERSAYFADLFGADPFGRLFALRALAYREIREGSDAVREAYRNMAETAPPEVAAQARQLLWRSEKPTRALFGGAGHSSFKLYADDRFVGEGDDPVAFHAFPVEFEPGPHMLRAEVVSKGEQSGYTLGFSSAYTTVVADLSWDYTVTRPEGWPASDGDPAAWKPYTMPLGFLPTMQWWQFAPNAILNVQSQQQWGGPYGGWERPAGNRIYLRRRIDVPADVKGWANPFRRRYEIRDPAVRPATDTSNEGLKRL